MHDKNNDSVNSLLNRLCLSILLQHDGDDVLNHNQDQVQAAVRKLKAKGFQILLKKTPWEFQDDVNNSEDFEPQRALDVQIFAAKLNSRVNFESAAKFEEFEKHLAVIRNEPYFSDGTGKGILQFLLALQGNVHDEYEAPVMCPPELLVPGTFTLHDGYGSNPYYPTLNDFDIMDPKPKLFKGIQQIKSTDNPYLPRFLFEGEKNQLSALDNMLASSHSPFDKHSELTFTGMTKRLLGSSLRINIDSLRLFPETYKQPTTKPLKFTAPGGIVQPTKSEVLLNTEPKKIFSWNWEGLDCFGVTCSKNFAGDTSVSLLLQSYVSQKEKRTFEAKLLKEQHFLKDLKSLTVGIQSDIFHHDEFMLFYMVPNITIDGVLPATIKCFVTDFLECGTCYKRIKTMIMRRDYKLMFDGFMFKALCSALDEYLLTFREYVFAKEDEHLLGFYQRMKKMMKQIASLCYTLAIHPNVEVSVKPPMGSQFMGYLYREIMRQTENDYITLLVFILKRCCHVYFKHLQKWIYYGLLDDPCNELFIGFVDHYRENTKYFYDKAYFIRKESVSGFFQNFEDQILQCGKYTMLLKACNPNHPLFELEYPSISVCLSLQEIEQMELNCTKYFENAKKVCAKPVTIRSVFETRAEEKRKFYQRIIDRSRANLERWTDEQNERALFVAEEKKRRLDDLTAQLEDAKLRKINERKANVEIELKYLREAERLEEEHMIKENINLKKRIEYYQELSDMINVERAAEKRDRGNRNLLVLQIPSCTESQPSLRTPGTAGTNFESCLGDDDCDDEVSEYEECISDDFIEKFSQNETELKNTYDTMAKVNVLQTDLTEPLSATPKDVPSNEENANLLNTFMKRSVSDMINCNVLQENRQKAMSGNNMDHCFKTLAVDVSNGKEVTSEEISNKEVPMTEAHRNKLKVLSEEFGFRTQTAHTKSMPDVNLNTRAENELTELQRNRRRMMETDIFSEYHKDPIAVRSNLYLKLDSDRARNRQKILESEYNILTGKSSLDTVEVENCMTPMSTASDDTPTTEEAVSENRADKDNGNVSKVVSSKSQIATENSGNGPNLKINVLTVADDTCHKFCLPTAATFVEATPECGLNTAGIMAKQGFSFPNTDKWHNQQQDASTGAPIDNGSWQLEEACPEPDYNNPYNRCRELIETNFKCTTSSPYIRLNYPPKRKEFTNKSTILIESLTEFLQKSVVVPMSAHLELVNNEVMRLFLHDLKVLEHFRSLRNYFFMMDGEFGSIICDGIIGKLEEGAKPEKLLNYQILHSVLDTALGSSITGKDKNAENLSFIVVDVPEKFDLNSPDVLNNLSLSYRIQWPLNLILNPETLDQYGNIFKYLVRVRRISWILEKTYQILKENVKLYGNGLLKSAQYRHVQLIRHKFYHFVHALQNHITANALASWKTFKDELLTANTIEDIYRKHATYIKRILFLCMLNKRSAEFHNTIDSIFKISIRFYNNLKSREFKRKPGQVYFTHSRYEKLVADELEFDKFIKYTIYLGNKIVRHGYQTEIGEFISLINYNQYYTKNSV